MVRIGDLNIDICNTDKKIIIRGKVSQSDLHEVIKFNRLQDYQIVIQGGELITDGKSHDGEKSLILG